MSPLRLSLLALVVVCLTSLGLASCARPAGCQRNSDCHKSYCAADGECKKDCIDEKLDCPAGWTCDETARCVAPPGWVDPGDGGTAGSGTGGGQGGQGDGDGGDAGNGGQGGSGGGGSGGGGSGGGAGGSGGGGTITYALDSCSTDADCTAPAFCREMYKGGPFRCTTACTHSQQCPSGTRCENINGDSYCAQSDVGKACSTGDECNFACITEQSICTSKCDSGHDCPNGYGCMNYGGERVCARMNTYCGPTEPGDPPNEACIVPAACDTSRDNYFYTCTIPCNSSLDCPQRAAGLPLWTCKGGLCKRPSDVSGPQLPQEQALYFCSESGSPVNACGDSLRWNFNTGEPSLSSPPIDAYWCFWEDYGDLYYGQWDDSCAESCQYQGGCRFGYACSALTALGSNPPPPAQINRIGLCVPTGFGAIGDACSHDSDCALGYCLKPAGKCTRDCSADGVCPKGFTCTGPGDNSLVEGKPFRRCL